MINNAAVQLWPVAVHGAEEKNPTSLEIITLFFSRTTINLWYVYVTNLEGNREEEGRAPGNPSRGRAHKHAWRSELPQLSWFTGWNHFLAKSVLSEAALPGVLFKKKLTVLKFRILTSSYFVLNMYIWKHLYVKRMRIKHMPLYSLQSTQFLTVLARLYI